MILCDFSGEKWWNSDGMKNGFWNEFEWKLRSKSVMDRYQSDVCSDTTCNNTISAIDSISTMAVQVCVFLVCLVCVIFLERERKRRSVYVVCVKMDKRLMISKELRVFIV